MKNKKIHLILEKKSYFVEYTSMMTDKTDFTIA